MTRSLRIDLDEMRDVRLRDLEALLVMPAAALEVFDAAEFAAAHQLPCRHSIGHRVRRRLVRRSRASRAARRDQPPAPWRLAKWSSASVCLSTRRVCAASTSLMRRRVARCWPSTHVSRPITALAAAVTISVVRRRSSMARARYRVTGPRRSSWRSHARARSRRSCPGRSLRRTPPRRLHRD